MTHTPLPSRDVLKAQARRLRATLSKAGRPLNHAGALELLAQQWGYRDWNTLSDAANRPKSPGWSLGQRVSGRYLGHDFTGTVKSARLSGPEHVKLTITFDDPIDVVASPRFSALRTQVTCTLGPTGETIEKTSDGQPHLVLARP